MQQSPQHSPSESFADFRMTLPPRPCRGVPSSIPGLYDANLPPIVCTVQVTGGICNNCEGEIRRRAQVEEDKRTAARNAVRLEEAGLPRAFVAGRKSLDSFEILTPIHQQAKAQTLKLIEWTDDNGAERNILLDGDAGTGKTYLLQAWVRELILRGKRARYVNHRDLALRLQASFGDHAKESADRIIDEYTSPKGPAVFLALDDLGATKPTRFVSDSLYTLLDRRTRHELPTICSSNYPNAQQLAERLLPPDGDALDAIRPVDRLRELTPNHFTFRGKSQRAIVNRGRDAQIARGDE